ncbi:MAG: DUF445 family protein [Oscillospiraceae bacterium]|nr:DUF445 family protein [Oscillospiraceae bacterium]
MEYLHYIAGPLIGAFIGYCTNYIAVKMLFHPYKEVKLFGLTLPFTPGVIPKNKPRLARAIARAVSDVLLTKEDMAGLITDAAIDSAGTALVSGSGLFGNSSPDDLARRFGMDGLHTEQLEDFLTDKVWEGIKSMDIGGIVAAKAQEVVRANPMLSLLPVGSIIATIKAKVGEYVDSEDCRDKIAEVVDAKVNELKNAPTGETLADVGMTAAAAEGLVVSVIHRLLDAYLEPVLNMLHIDRIIEDKINDMDIAMFEELVISVMKTELNAIVNLGFFIGLIIGVINIFI